MRSPGKRGCVREKEGHLPDGGGEGWCPQDVHVGHQGADGKVWKPAEMSGLNSEQWPWSHENGDQDPGGRWAGRGWGECGTWMSVEDR